MDTSKKKNLKIAAATGMTIFSLVATFTAVFAWFVQNHSIDASGMTIKVTAESGRLNKIEIFEYIETIEKTSYDEEGNPVLDEHGNPVTFLTYSFDDEPSGSIYGGDGSFENSFLMGDYNPLSTEHPILILFTLEGGFVSTAANDMFIKGATTAAGFLGATNEQGLPVYKLGSVTSEDPVGTKTLKRGTKDVPVDPENPDGAKKTVDCYPLSSVINFKCTHYSSASYTKLINDSTANRIDIPTESVTLRQSFVNFASSGAGIEFKNEPLIYSSPGGNEPIQYVAMIVNYDGNAVSAIYSTYLGNSTLEETYGGSLYFTCDWVLEVF